MSDAGQIRHVLIWSSWLRLSHWLIAFGVSFEIVSAWLINNAYIDLEFWRDWHVMVGQGLVFVLVGRIVLLFAPGSGNWRSLVPGSAQLRTMFQMLKFYLSFARLPLPNWYAHNPLWAPVYVLLLIVLAMGLTTGFAYHQPYRIADVAIARVHQWAGSVLTILALGHVAAVLLHDWKGRGALVSAMFSGYRYFHVSSSGKTSTGTSTVSVDDLRNSASPQRRRDSSTDGS